MPAPTRNDFKKAMSGIVLTAGAALAEAQRATSKAGAFNRRKADQAHGLTVEFCRLLLGPVEEHSLAKTLDFPESYCRQHLPVATRFLTKALATHAKNSPECRRLLRIAGLIEANLKSNLDEATAKLCWFGAEADTVARESQKHSFG